MRPTILIIKHGALGDFMLALGAMRAIRRHHHGARFILLTRPGFVGLAESLEWFDAIWADDTPKIWNVLRLAKLKRHLNSIAFERVYDLQASQRSTFYYNLLQKPRPPWSGLAKASPLFHNNPQRSEMHTLDRLSEQLKIAGIEEVPEPELPMLPHKIDQLDVPKRFALLVPGGSAHRPKKRWPASHYASLAKHLLSQNITPVLIGARDDLDTIDTIRNDVAGCLDLSCQTTIGDLAELGRRAELAVGNDTGPMHVLTVAGCRCVVLFSQASDPARTAPRGSKNQVTVLQKPNLKDLKPEEVIEMIEKQAIAA